MGRFDRAPCGPSDVLVLGVIFEFERLLRQRIGPNGARRNALGRRQVFLHQNGRNGEHVADVVEAMAGIV